MRCCGAFSSGRLGNFSSLAILSFIMFSIMLLSMSKTFSAQPERTSGVLAKPPNGPPPLCEQTKYPLYRTEMRDIICSGSNNHAIGTTIPKTLNGEPLKLIFLHVPKTGGESLEALLKIKKNHTVQGERAKEYSNAKHHLAVTIIRNPFSRMFSWFRFCIHGSRGHIPSPHKFCRLALDLFADMPQPNNAVTVSSAFEQWLSIALPVRDPVHPWFSTTVDYIGGIFPLQLDYYIRFEHYDEDTRLLLEALGRNATEVVHENSSSGNSSGLLASYKNHTQDEVKELLSMNYDDVYTDTARNLVEFHFAKDLVAFGYRFDP